VFLAFQGQVEYVPRVLGTLIGLAILVGGVVLIKLSGPLTKGLNTMYRALPGRFQYPPRFVALFGAVVCAFGGIVAILSMIRGR
jgi:hypothetical protein